MSIAIRQLRRQFGEHVALDSIDLTIADGEFIAVLGPSGSGKTSLLRILAGLDDPDSGSIHRDEHDLLALDARRRGVGLVFQHYALFPHMTVAQNIAFGLRIRPRRTRPGRSQIDARVAQLLQQVQLSEFGARYPAQLSGGQRQRVALARALAIEPSLLLLDEPFGALDAQVRISLRRWLREFHRELGITSLFVTHDQEEALELADRVVVMEHGRIEQVGTPAQIYRQPATPFVSRFIARGQALPARHDGQALYVAGQRWSLPDTVALQAGDELVVHVRPEHIQWQAAPGAALQAHVLELRTVGDRSHASLAVSGVSEPLEAVWHGDEGSAALRPAQAVGVRWRALSVFVLDAQQRVRERFELGHGGNGHATRGVWQRVNA